MYINCQRPGCAVETVDEAPSREEARALCQEYLRSDPGAYYYVSQRCTRSWN